MTLDELIEEAVSIRLAHPGAGDWEVVAPDDKSCEDWYGLARMAAVPDDQEVRLT